MARNFSADIAGYPCTATGRLQAVQEVIEIQARTVAAIRTITANLSGAMNDCVYGKGALPRLRRLVSRA
jgi:hypothetical protein